MNSYLELQSQFHSMKMCSIHLWDKPALPSFLLCTKDYINYLGRSNKPHAIAKTLSAPSSTVDLQQQGQSSPSHSPSHAAGPRLARKRPGFGADGKGSSPPTGNKVTTSSSRNSSAASSVGSQGESTSKGAKVKDNVGIGSVSSSSKP